MIFDVSASALEAQRIRMNVIANNIANAQTTRTEDGGPYKRRAVVFEAVGGTKSTFAKILAAQAEEKVLGGGVTVAKIVEASGPEAFMDVYEPSHPDADKNGIVRKPNIRVVDEMVNLIDASRAYEANVTAMNTTKQIAAKTLEIGRNA
jgi:flagellar basal-body rod protein FlgC